MTKLRVHELAKELDKTNKEVLDFLKKENVDVKSHMSSLEEEQVMMVKKAFSSNPEGSKEKEHCDGFPSSKYKRRRQEHGAQRYESSE